MPYFRCIDDCVEDRPSCHHRPPDSFASLGADPCSAHLGKQLSAPIRVGLVPQGDSAALERLRRAVGALHDELGGRADERVDRASSRDEQEFRRQQRERENEGHRKTGGQQARQAAHRRAGWSPALQLTLSSGERAWVSIIVAQPPPQNATAATNKMSYLKRYLDKAHAVLLLADGGGGVGSCQVDRLIWLADALGDALRERSLMVGTRRWGC